VKINGNSIFIMLSVMLAAACSPAIKVKDTWTPPNLEAQRFNKIGVVMISDNEATKDKIESLISEKMRSLNYPVVPTFTLFPFAGNKEVEAGMNMSEDERQAYIRERVNKFNFEAILIISVLGSEENFKSKPSVGVGVSAPMNYYDANYTQYWSYASVYAATPSYYKATDYYLESSLFDVATEELHWTAQFDISDPKSITKISEQFAERLIQVMIKDGVLLKE
jgi:hypothetical protein